ncbi:MAG: hypothetical protein P4M04_16050 [Acidobacteriota bacterium]|nr:hypothetical protein [Acidobacteriota bacterium]
MPRLLPLLVALLLGCLGSQAEDVKLREQADQLMEIANAASHPGVLHNFAQSVTFRVYEPDGSVQEGTSTRVSAGATGHRDERTFGEYHHVIVISGDRISQHATGPMPPEVRELKRQLPIHVGRFDQSNVIHSIQQQNVLGHPAKCIEFDTLTNGVPRANEICMDTERAVVLGWRVGDEYIENSDFFRVASLYEPAHIRRFLNGKLQMEVGQQMKVIDARSIPMFSPRLPLPGGRCTSARRRDGQLLSSRRSRRRGKTATRSSTFWCMATSGRTAKFTNRLSIPRPTLT